MHDFSGVDAELLIDFLTEGTDILSDVDNKLVALEKDPNNKTLLNDIFRGFHTIKGGAGFVNAGAMVSICHRTENLFDKLRSGELVISQVMMDVILESTGVVRSMFGDMAPPSQKMPLEEEFANLMGRLELAALGRLDESKTALKKESAKSADAAEEDLDALFMAASSAASTPIEDAAGNDIDRLFDALSGGANPAATSAAPPAVTPIRQQESAAPVVTAPKETTIRIDTSRLDQVLNLSGEIGLTKNRLTTLRQDIVSGKMTSATVKFLDQAVSQLDLLVGDLQNAVMKTRMQPIGRLFQKYPRVARELARKLGKQVDLVISGEETELDKTMVEDLSDPLLHLVRNSLDHAIESPEVRIAAGKSSSGMISLSAYQSGDHICIEIRDDGRGIKPDLIRRKAVEKGLITPDYANGLDDKQSLGLIFLPGFSTAESVSSISGRGVGMDVVKTNIQKLNGRIDIQSTPGEGTTIQISLPLTLAILSVLVVRIGEQSFAIPLSVVREIVTIRDGDIQEVGGRKVMIVRDEVLVVRSLSGLLSWPEGTSGYGAVIQWADSSFIMSVDGFVGRDDVVIKPLLDVKPRGIAGATLSGDGEIVMIVDLEEVLGGGTEIRDNF